MLARLYSAYEYVNDLSANNVACKEFTNCAEGCSSLGPLGQSVKGVRKSHR